MNKKLFYILLFVLSGYGLIMSALTHMNSRGESIFYFFNMGAEFVVIPIGMFYSLFGSPTSDFAYVSWGYLLVVANLIFWIPIAFAISSCFSKEKKFSPRKLNTRNKILVISVILVVFVFLPALIFTGQPPVAPQTITLEMPSEIIFDDTSVFNSTKDISEIPGLEIIEDVDKKLASTLFGFYGNSTIISPDEFEIIDVTPEMWYENQKRAEEENAIRLEQLEKFKNDPDFVKATKIIQELNSTNIEDDAYWQTVLDSLIIITEKEGINGTLSFEDSEMLRELLRQEKIRQEKQRESEPSVIIEPSD